MSNLGNSFKIWDVIFRVSDAFDKDGFCVLIDRRSKVLWLVSIDELCIYAQSWQEYLELVVCSSIYVCSGYDIISGMAQSRKCHELSCLTRAGSYCGYTAFQRCNSFLEYIDRWL